jgi:Xaa-Pro dipeptidase
MPDDVRLAKLQKMIVDGGYDAVVCVSPENIAYSAGFVVPSQTLMRWRHAAVIITSQGQVAVVCVDMEGETVRKARPEWEVRTWREFADNAMEVLASTLAELGLSNHRIGIELNYLGANQYNDLVKALPTAEFVSADGDLTHLRRLKSPEEIELLTELSRISDTAILRALTSVTAGDTEMDIAAELTRSVYSQGADAFKLMIVATGERSQLPNVGPSMRKLQAGDICRVEIFAVKNGYQAGVCRTASVGEPADLPTRIYENLVECKHIVRQTVKPNQPARAVYAAYRNHFDKLLMPPIAFVGHSIGVNLHEPPYLGADSTDVIEEAMVLGVEPLVYRTGHGFGMQIKDMLLVTGSGNDLLSDATDTDSMTIIAA